MKTAEVSKLAKNIDNNILELIDLKIDNDMEKVISEIRQQNTEIKKIESNMNSKFDAMDSKFAIILWAIGILLAVIIALKFLK